MAARSWHSSRRCARCAALSDPGDRFCTRCGTSLMRRRASRSTVAGMIALAAVTAGLSVAVGSSVIGDDDPPVAAGSPSPSPAPSRAPRLDLGEPFGHVVTVEDGVCPGTRLDCSSVTVPVDQLNPGNETMEVRFGVRRADERLRRGTLVIATGGPGSSGIELSGYYDEVLPSAVVERYDIVYFDQRGVGRSGALQCRESGAAEPAWSDVATRSSDAMLIEARLWVQECLAEAGFELSPDLDRYGTLHAAADLDAYLDAIGADEVVLFGESYGTSLAQVYAARRPERVAGLILDAVVDPTLDALSAAIEQSASFGDVLDQVLESCLDDQWCAGDFLEADPATVWDDLSARLASGPITVEIPVYGGGVREIRLHLNDFINVTGGHLYAPSDRGTFLRLLAFAGRGDLRPLARTSEFVAGRDPERGTVLASADGGVAAYFAINCQGHGHTGTGAIESLRQRLADEVGRMADLALSYLPCLAGFAGPTLERQPDWEALQEADFPTIVLTSTMDPATPQAWAEAVAERLTNAYLIVTRNGAHGTFGLTSCADEVIEDFLLARDLPDDRRTTCHGSVIDLYVPLPYPSLADYADVLDALVAVEEELWSMPDVVYWDGVPNSISCPHGGDMDMRWNAAHELRLNACEVIDGWPLSGPVSFALDGETTMSVDWPDGSVEYESTFDWTVTVVGTVDGRRVDLSR